MDGTKTIAETIELRITRDILKGDLEPGVRLPSVRQLAQNFAVTVPTIQRVISRLEGKRLVEARQSSGVYVNDPLKSGGIELLPDWFDLLKDDPTAATKLLADILEIRRSLGELVLRNHFDDVIQTAEKIVPILANIQTATTSEEIGRLDLQITETIVQQTGNLAYVLLFNSIKDMILEVPYLMLAMYGNAEETVNNVQQTAALFTGGNQAEDVAAYYRDQLSQIDRKTVARYRRIIEQQASARLLEST